MGVNTILHALTRLHKEASFWYGLAVLMLRASRLHRRGYPIPFSAHKYTLNYFSVADMLYSSTNTFIS